MEADGNTIRQNRVLRGTHSYHVNQIECGVRFPGPTYHSKGVPALPKPYHELSANELRSLCDPSQFDFLTTAEVPPLEGIIGQGRAIRAMEFGLRIKSRGYNIFVTGPSGTGKNTYVRDEVRKHAALERVAEDWCYIYNFRRPDEPLALCLPAGTGHEFRQDMEELVEELKSDIPKAFESEDYEKQKEAVVREFQEQTQARIETLEKLAEEKGLALRRTSTGFATIPIVNDKPLTPDEYEALDEPTKKTIEERNKELHTAMGEVTRRIRQLEKLARERVKELDKGVGLFAVGGPIGDLKEKYKAFPRVLDYLTQVESDVILNLDDMKSDEDGEPPVPWLRRAARQASVARYKVNLVVDNRDTKGAPVVLEANPTYYNLFGKLEYKQEFGAMATDFTMIKAGALQKANGGYLVLQAADVLKNPWSWDALKRALKNREARPENMAEQFGVLAFATLKPEPMPVDVKVIVVGNPYLYHLLYHYDEDFQKLFKIRVDFDSQMERTGEHVRKYAEFISSLCSREDLLPFDRQAVARVVEYSSRLAESQAKLSTRFNEIAEVAYESSALASLEGNPVVGCDHVDRAVREKNYRSNRLEERVQELFAQGKILVDVHGSKVGQLNGISIIDLGDYSFGRPARLTATARVGEKGVVDIEREVELAGSIHNKGVMILTGYLLNKYAVDQPLALSASLCFEQTYEEVDGDSASSTELYALLSSLSGLPLSQGIAVTGSVNQKGEIQPVGGVNRKIEGFYITCKLKGLDGTQGVIIPRQNAGDLMLDHEVVEAVRKGQFHIYPVKTVDEGIEILAGVPAGEPGEDGVYPEGTVNYLVEERLRAMAETMAEFGRSPAKTEE
ncbi:MAG: AAA family ATPase [Firmicutes bacterium]|nr:AAA family ATPase [Bacillota bacterium]